MSDVYWLYQLSLRERRDLTAMLALPNPGTPLSARRDSRGRGGSVGATSQGSTAGSDVRSLLVQAESVLSLHDAAADAELRKSASDAERVAVQLVIATEDLRDEPTLANAAQLEQCLEIAQKAKVSLVLRVRARLVLKGHQSKRKRVKGVEEEIVRLLTQLEQLVSTNVEAKGQEGGGRDEEEEEGEDKVEPTALDASIRRSRAEKVFRQLRNAVETASLSSDRAISTAVEIAKIAMVRVLQEWQAQESQELRLRKVLCSQDAGTIEEGLAAVRKQRREAGLRSRRVVEDLEERRGKLIMAKKRQQWLEHELAEVVAQPLPVVATTRDGAPSGGADASGYEATPEAAAQEEEATPERQALRLRELIAQARRFDLTVPPKYVKALGELNKKASKPHVQVKPDGDRLKKAVALALMASKAVTSAETMGTSAAFDMARRRIAEASQGETNANGICAIRRRLGLLELEDGPRIRAQDQLEQLMAGIFATDWHGRNGLHVVQDGAKLEQLRAAIEEANIRQVDDERALLAAEELYERSIIFEDNRRLAEKQLRAELSQATRKDGDIDSLSMAIEEGKRCGLPVLHAEHELMRAHDALVHREAASAELQEAVKGTGAVGRSRLESAIRAARLAGINAQLLRSAGARLAELERHDNKCELLAGNLRRAIPLIASEPWRMQQLIESARALHPQTSELERLVAQSRHQLERTVVSQKEQRMVQQELHNLLNTLGALRTRRETTDSDVDAAAASQRLAELMPRAQSLGVKEELLHEGRALMKAFRREGCQHAVAEHRLRIALNQKDLGEIERAVREVRALGTTAHALSENSGGSASTRTGDRANRSGAHSARLVDAADAMIRHLGDVAQRKQAATTALLVHITDDDAQGAMPLGVEGEAAKPNSHETSLGPRSIGGGAAHGSEAPGAGAQPGSAAWLRDVTEVVKEAQQSGVASSLIGHARMRIREQRREHSTRESALKNLERSLAKKTPHRHELIRNVQRVQRVVPQSLPGFPSLA